MSIDAANFLHIPADKLLAFGPGMHKVAPACASDLETRTGKLVLVTGITPTSAGEGKTTTSIGLGDALRKLGAKASLALREPSLGPCFGVKGGGTGGGHAQLVPSDRINLHFTGDFHAITAAHNLLAAVIDNHLHHRSDLDLDARSISWPRVLDVNDRALRSLVTGLGGSAHGTPRESSFDITAASELMAMLCLADDADDLRMRIERVIVGRNGHGEAVRAGQLGITGAMMALLRDALMPNLVETKGGTPAFVHGGPFANIAHGCSSVMATRTALHHSDWVVTEAGFGSDLGAEKFFDIKCRSAGLDPHLVVLVASARALKLHGGVSPGDLDRSNPAAVRAGLANLDRHLASIEHFGKASVVALNRFHSDTDEELQVVLAHLEARGVRAAVATHFVDGGEGALQLASHVLAMGDEPSAPHTPAYELGDSVAEKLHKVAVHIYGGDGVDLSASAERDIRQLEADGLSALPICVAKTPGSLSDDSKLLGCPTGFRVQVQRVLPNAGAGFLVVMTGAVMRMPGLPRRPQAEKIDLRDGDILHLR